MVLFCEDRPLEVGNFVWWDNDFDGVQDPSEPGIQNVAVELYKWNGSAYVKVAETTTDTYGRYIFSQSGNANGLNTETWTIDNAVLPNTQYQVRIPSWNTDTGLSTYRTSLGFTDHLVTTNDSQGTAGEERDSDGIEENADVVVTFTTGSTGENAHRYDFGFNGVGGCVNPDVVPTANVPCDGATLNLMATVSGGMAPYTYNWTGPNSFNATDQNPSIAAADRDLLFVRYRCCGLCRYNAYSLIGVTEKLPKI